MSRRHGEYFFELAERIAAQEHLGGEDIDWPAYERELGNLRRAYAWFTAQEDVEHMLRLFAAMPSSRFGTMDEAARLLDEALPHLPQASPAAQAKFLMSASFTSWQRGELDEARDYGERSLALAREVGDRVTEADVLFSLSVTAGLLDDGATRRSYTREAEAVFRDLGMQSQLLWLRHNEGLWAVVAGDYAQARAHLEEVLDGARALGLRDTICNAICDLGVVALYEQRLEDASQLFAESLELAQQRGWHVNIAYTVNGLGCALAVEGALEKAARLLGAAEAMFERTGRKIEPYAAPIFDTSSAPVRERLADPVLAAAWATGRAMTEADAVASALATVGARTPL